MFQGAAVDGMYCRLAILINIDFEYMLLNYRWIAGLLVWVTIYAVLTSLGFCKFKNRLTLFIIKLLCNAAMLEKAGRSTQGKRADSDRAVNKGQ